MLYTFDLCGIILFFVLFCILLFCFLGVLYLLRFWFLYVCLLNFLGTTTNLSSKPSPVVHTSFQYIHTHLVVQQFYHLKETFLELLSCSNMNWLLCTWSTTVTLRFPYSICLFFCYAFSKISSNLSSNFSTEFFSFLFLFNLPLILINSTCHDSSIQAPWTVIRVPGDPILQERGHRDRVLLKTYSSKMKDKITTGFLTRILFDIKEF